MLLLTAFASPPQFDADAQLAAFDFDAPPSTTDLDALNLTGAKPAPRVAEEWKLDDFVTPQRAHLDTVARFDSLTLPVATEAHTEWSGEACLCVDIITAAYEDLERLPIDCADWRYARLFFVSPASPWTWMQEALQNVDADLVLAKAKATIRRRLAESHNDTDSDDDSEVDC